MSDQFDYLEYIKSLADPKPEAFNLRKYLSKVTDWQVNEPTADESENLTATISRYSPPTSYIPPIVIRNVRNVEQNVPPIIVRNVRNEDQYVPPLIVRKVHVDDANTQAITSRQLAQYLAIDGGVVVNTIRRYWGKARNSCYWQDSGWERRGDYLIGSYRVGSNRSYAGSIELSDSVVDPMNFYIYDPPQEFLGGPHGACIMYRGEVEGLEKYFIHFSERPTDIDSGIIQIQRELKNAIGA